MLQDLSPIQNHILSKLKNVKVARYRDMQPKDVPNDLYNYHLQFLIKKGLVAKTETGYALSASGIKHVADPYPANNAITSLFKINVITVLSRIKNGKIEILNQIRKSNPSYGKVGVMGGVVLKGEPLEVAATRKLQQETGLKAKFKQIGCERRIMYVADELFSDVLFPIMYASSGTGKLQVETDFGHNMWVPINQAIKNESAEFDSIKSIVKVLRAIKQGSVKKLPFFFAENVQRNLK